MRLFAASLLALLPLAAHAADPLDRRIRPQLPPSIRTVGAALQYYLAPTGFRFYLQTPVAGDGRALAARAVRRIPEDAPIVTVRSALQAVLPEHVRLYIDRQGGAVAIAEADEDARPVVVYAALLSMPDTTPAEIAPPASAPETAAAVAAALDRPAQVPAPAPAATPPAASAAPAVAEAPAHSSPAASTAPAAPRQVDEIVLPSPTHEASAPANPPPPATPVALAPSFAVHTGSTVRGEIEQWGREAGFTVEWDAEIDAPITADYAFNAATFRDAVSQLLQAANMGFQNHGYTHRLRAIEQANKTVRIYTP